MTVSLEIKCSDIEKRLDELKAARKNIELQLVAQTAAISELERLLLPVEEAAEEQGG